MGRSRKGITGYLEAPSKSEYGKDFETLSHGGS
jgi:hypothetical protein